MSSAVEEATGHVAATPSRLGYRPALDGIRAVAVGAVILHHLNWLPGGHLGVTMFFTLSGFLITTLLLEEQARSGRINLRAFYLRRVRRLVPALVAVLVASSIWVATTQQNPLRVILIGAGTSLGYVSNFATAAGAPTGDAYGWSWSLSIEEQFYLLWAPLMLLLAFRRQWLVLLAVAGSAVAILERWAWAHPHTVTPMALYVRTDARADAILVGCLAAFAYRRGWLRRLSDFGPLALVVLVLEFRAADPTIRSTYTTGMVVAELATVVLIAGAVYPTLVSRVLASRPMVHIGRISYALYLWDVLIRDVVAQWFHQDPWHLSTTPVIVSVALTFVAAELSQWLVERPFMRLRVGQ